MHPKCAAALADKDGKNLLTFKGRTEVTTRTSGRIYEKKEAAEMRSRIVFLRLFFCISIRNKTTCCVYPENTNHQGQDAHCRINSFDK